MPNNTPHPDARRLPRLGLSSLPRAVGVDVRRQEPISRHEALDRYRVLLLDMNGTFMFGRIDSPYTKTSTALISTLVALLSAAEVTHYIRAVTTA